MTSRRSQSILDDSGNLNPLIIDAIKDAVKSAIKEEIKETLEELKKVREDIQAINTRIDAIDQGLNFASKRLDSVIGTMLPALSDHMAKLSQGLVKQNLELETHRRKWNLILHGIKGGAGEDPKVTRAACVTFAKDVLGVTDASDARLAACHRLFRKTDAGIIIRFFDLKDRDAWLSSAGKLKHHPTKVTLCPDLPPSIRPLKDALMLQRKNLSAELKNEARIRYTPHFPFVELKVKDVTHKPDTPFSAIAAQILGCDPYFRIVEPTEEM